MDKSGFAKLPQEVRDKIWTQALRPDPNYQNKIYLKSTPDWKPNDDELTMEIFDKNLRALRALTATCKQMRGEVFQTFADTNTIVFTTTMLRGSLSSILESSSRDELAPLRRWIRCKISKHNVVPRRIELQLGFINTSSLASGHQLRALAIKSIARIIATTSGRRTQWSLTFTVSCDFECKPNGWSAHPRHPFAAQPPVVNFD